MREAVKELWNLCFDDNEEFVDMYFRLRYNDDINVTIEEKEKVVAALQMLPYPMTFCGHTVQTSYISGACTHPDYRGNGRMRQLLGESFKRMFNAEIHFSTLIPAEPWLFDYYANAGYVPVFQYSVQEVNTPENFNSENIKVESITNYQEDIYLYIYRKQAERPCCILHMEEDFRAIMEDIVISDGFLWVAREKGEITGVAVGYLQDKQLVIKELFAENEITEQCLLYSAGQQTSFEKFIRLLPPDDTKMCYSLGMARTIHARKVLKLYAAAFPEQEMWLQVSDKQLPENNGYYHLHEGECTFSTGQQQPGTYTSLNINELTNKILQPLRPYMSLMMD